MQPQHYTLTLVLSMSIAYLVIVRSYTFIHVCPLTQFIIIVLCICLLNHLRNKKKLQAKNINTTRFHNCLCGYFDQRFCFLHLASSCHLVSLCFSLKDAPSRFQQGGAVCWALPSHFSCVSLCDTVDCSPQAPLSMGISRQEILEWVAMPSSRGSSQHRDQTFESRVFRISGEFSTAEPPGKPRAGLHGSNND